jgi:hypothetical protein
MGKEALDGLVECLQNPSNPVCTKDICVDLIISIKDPAATNAILTELNKKDSSETLRIVSNMLSMDWKEPLAVEPLMQAFERSDYAPEVRRKACIVLGRLGDPRALPMLMAKLKTDGDEMVQNEMVIAMDKITGQEHHWDNKARLEWVQKNHPEWLEYKSSFRQPDTSYAKLIWVLCIGAILGLGLIVWLWKK